MATKTGSSPAHEDSKDRAQIQHPLTLHYLKIDTRTGRVVEAKKTKGPYKGLKDLTSRRG